METKFNLSFLFRYLRSMDYAFFQRRAAKDLDAKIAVVREALARAQGVLQDLEARRKQALSTIATSSSTTVPQEDSFFTGVLL